MKNVFYFLHIVLTMRSSDFDYEEPTGWGMWTAKHEAIFRMLESPFKVILDADHQTITIHFPADANLELVKECDDHLEKSCLYFEMIENHTCWIIASIAHACIDCFDADKVKYCENIHESIIDYISMAIKDSLDFRVRSKWPGKVEWRAANVSMIRHGQEVINLNVVRTPFREFNEVRYGVNFQNHHITFVGGVVHYPCELFDQNMNFELFPHLATRDLPLTALDYESVMDYIFSHQ